MENQNEIDMEPKFKQVLDDVFDAFSMLAGGQIVSLMHVRGDYTRYSPAAVDLFGFPGEYIKNGSVNWNDYLHPEDRKRYMDVMGKLVTGESMTYDITYRVRTTKGEYQNFRAVGAVIREENGQPDLIGGMLINQGITQTVDPVTVLPNKLAYREQLTKFMQDGKDTVSLQVGISQMESINRVNGYSYGNRILQESAWLIQEIAKERAQVFRTDGATFTLLSDSLSREEISAIYDMIRYRMQRGIQVNGIKSILAANGGLISTHGTEIKADTVYSCLSYAYEESKESKHGKLVDFNGSMNYESSKLLEMLDTIRNDVLDECKGFTVLYDQVISSETEKATGAEAVISWHNEQYGTVSGEVFMPMLERDFLFDELSDFILKKTFCDGVELNKKQPGFLLCINIYRIQLESDYFVDNLFQILSETGFPSEQLSLKFTSDCRYVGIERLRVIIEKLHKKNVLAIIDSFGSGTDSILFLKNAPVDAVSIDTGFTSGIETSQRDRDIVDYLARMAASYVKHINVSGITTKETRDALKGLPVTTMQGTYWSESLTFAELLNKV